jgi:hypothetical protein
LFDGQVCRLLTPEKPPGINAGLALTVEETRAVAHQAPGYGELALLVERRSGGSRRQRGHLIAPVEQNTGRGA